LSNEEKTKDYENFEKGMIYMKILKKGEGSREKGTDLPWSYNANTKQYHLSTSIFLSLQWINFTLQIFLSQLLTDIRKATNINLRQVSPVINLIVESGC
jgi:hypothetical protein